MPIVSFYFSAYYLFLFSMLNVYFIVCRERSKSLASWEGELTLEFFS